MPRIRASSVAEHVAQQHAAVLDAAIELFTERGYNDVGLGDIAERVGLARNSLYRYFPDRAHILAAWFDQVMDPLVAVGAEIAARAEPATARLRRWVTLQLEFLIEPAHEVMIDAALTAPDLPDELRRMFAGRHRDLYGSLEQILVDGGVARIMAPVRALLIAGLIRSGGDLHRRGTPRKTLFAELTKAAAAVAGFPADG